MSKEIESHILDYFEIKTFMGSGAYGHVWHVVHRQSGKQYALKKIFDAFQNEVDAQRTYRQLSHQNIIKLQWVIRAHNNKDLYLVFELVEIDLHSLLGQNILTGTHIRFVAYQLLKAMKYIHSAQLIHRDLKSSNILINSNCQIKVIDFGLVRSLVKQQQTNLVLSEDVATRWYRSPEMLLGSQNYGKPTDVWSIGCILAQVVIGQPIFTGNSTYNQIQKILQFTGTPKAQALTSIGCSAAATFLAQLNIKKRPLKSFFNDCQSDILDMIVKMLQFDPNKRITVEEALQLQCLQEFRGKSVENVCQNFVITPLDDNIRLDTKDYRRAIHQDIERRYPDMNKITPMPRIFRAHHSLLSKKPQNFQRKGANSLIKLAKCKENEQFQANVHPANTIYRKPARALLKGIQTNSSTIKIAQMQSTNASLHEGTKIFKRKRNNLWPKQQHHKIDNIV